MPSETKSGENKQLSIKSQLVVVGLCLLTLPFSFGEGVAPTMYLLSALVVGGVWSVLSLLHWLTDNSIFSGIAFALIVLGQGACRKLYLEADPLGYFFQWVFIVFSVGVAVSALYYRVRANRLNSTGRTSRS